MPDHDDLQTRLVLPAYPRSARYDINWVIENAMGPNPLWLMEALTEHMALKRGMRVLDLGCGRALTSIFLAKEFDVQVWAADLWISATENWKRIVAAGVADQVVSLNAEAHALPFADGFFHSIVSVDAYHYFGTNELYLADCTRFLQPGGQIGIVVPGLVEELIEVPPHLAPIWEADWWTFHSPGWWRALWERSGVVEVSVADLLPDGCREWAIWEDAQGGDEEPWEGTKVLREDAGSNLGFTRVVARRTNAISPFDYRTGARLAP